MSLKEYLTEQNCPVCGSDKSIVVLKKDRYFLPINLSVCKMCSTLYTKNNFSIDKIGIFYKDFYRDLYNDVQEVTENFLIKSDDRKFANYRYSRIINFCNENEIVFNNIVEIGSGTGQFLSILDKNKKEFFGIEPGKTFYNYISKQTFGLKSTNDFFEEAKLPFLPHFFISFHVLEHIINPNNFLQNVYQKLSENGYVVMEVPCYDYDVQWEQYGVMDIHIAHVVYYTEETISKLFIQNGFNILKIEKNLRDDLIQNNLRIFAVKNRINNYTKKINIEKEINRYQNAFNKFTFLSKNGYLEALKANYKAILKLLFK